MTINKELLRKSIDWLRANPDRHITGNLAVDSGGKDCRPTDEGAQCFCVIGRLAKDGDVKAPTAEADYDFDTYVETILATGITDDREEADKLAGRIYGINDQHRFDEIKPFCATTQLSNQEILDRLEADYLS